MNVKNTKQQTNQPEKKTAFIVDTNVLVHDPQAIHILREEGKVLVIPWVVLLELDRLKGKPDIGLDAREAIRTIEDTRKKGDESLLIIRHPNFRSLGDLDKKSPDHQIIATAKMLAQNKEFNKVRLISRDSTVRILAREVGVDAENYRRDQVAVPEGCLKEVNVERAKIDGKSVSFPVPAEMLEKVQENEGVICTVKESQGKVFSAVRKGSNFSIIPSNINVMGLIPFSLNGDGKNWHQYIALAQLLDPEIKLVFLSGGSGSGKTLLAIASAFEQRRLYHRIIVTRPMVPLEDEDRMGFLPGDEKQKMSPWIRPVSAAISVVKNLNENNFKLVEKLFEDGKVVFESLDYIRGMTYHKTFMIVDEAQNLTPHQVKTIITRAGMHTKLVFTGDLGQIDRRRMLDEKSSGLAYAISKMDNHPAVGSTTFKETVRSPLAGLAEERM